MKRVAYAALFFLAGILFPILIWVGLGVAMSQWAATADKPVAAAVFLKRPMSEIQELLVRAGLWGGKALGE